MCCVGNSPGRGSRGPSEERLGLPAVGAAAPSAQPLSADSLWEKLSISSDKKVFIHRVKEHGCVLHYNGNEGLNSVFQFKVQRNCHYVVKNIHYSLTGWFKRKMQNAYFTHVKLASVKDSLID